MKFSGTGINIGLNGTAWQWQPSLTVHDPNPPITLESPAAPANTNRSVGAQFQTRTAGSRRRQTALWIGAMAPAAVQPVAVPVSAWIAAPRPRRRETERELVTVEPLQWQYIAPTVAAILPRPRVKVVAFPRKLLIPPDQPVYPATPATGPPHTAWLAAATRRVSQDRRIQRLPDQPAYPATPAPTVTDRATGETFQTRVSRSRRRLTAPDVIGVGAAAPPAVTPYIEAAEALRRRETRRALRKAEHAPSYPATPPNLSDATISAVTPARARRRKGRQGLFLTADASALSIPTPSSSPAVYPSFVPTGYNRRRETERRLRVVLDAPVHPQTPAVNVTDRTAGPTFQTRVSRSRRLLVAPEVLGVDAAPPVTSQAPISALVPARSIRRKSRPGLFLGGGVAVDGFRVPVPEAAFRLPKQHRAARLGRRLLRELPLLDRPQTPPVPPQPAPAWRLALAIRSAGLGRKVVPAAPQLEHPPTPVVPELTGGDEWIIRNRRRRGR